MLILHVWLATPWSVIHYLLTSHLDQQLCPVSLYEIYVIHTNMQATIGGNQWI